MKTKKTKEISFMLGIGCPPLTKQLKKTGIPKYILEGFDRDSQAITRLHVSLLLPNYMTNNLRERLIQKIRREIEKHNPR